MSFLPDANEKDLNRSRNSWFFQDFCTIVRDLTECNLDVLSQPQKVCITRFECVSSSLSNCLDVLISTAVFLELECKCTGWWSDGLKCQRRIISRLVYSPRSATGHVLATVRVLDKRHWIKHFKKCLVVIFMQKKITFFSQSMDSGGMVHFFFLAFFYFLWYVYCPL